MTLFGRVSHDERGYVNQSELAEASGTTIQAYMASRKNTLFVEALAEDLEMTVREVMIPGRGGGNPRPAMCHPRLALDMARWSNPKLAV